MTRRIIKLDVSVASKERQEGKGEYALHGAPVYSFDRETDPKPTDKEVWETSLIKAEDHFISFFTETKAWVEARKEYREEGETQTRLPKGEWGKDITARKIRLQPSINQEWRNAVGGVDFKISPGAPDIDKLEAGKYNFYITFYADDTRYKPTLRMTFEFDMTIGVEVIVPVGKYEYRELLSIVIRAIKDKFPFRASHKIIRELREDGRVIRYRDPITERIRWRPRIEIPLGAYSLDDLVNIIGKRIGEKSPYTEARHGIIPELIETGVITRFKEPITGLIKYRT